MTTLRSAPRILDLFSGIGGLAIASHWAGFETAAFCEIEPFCRKVLAKHWPDVPIHDDIKTLTIDIIRGYGRIDGVVGGFPCQDLSCAGRGAGLGTEDDPTKASGLWYEMLRVIRLVGPAFCILENVPALRTRGIDTVLAGLEAAGYACGAFVVGASAVGAPHRRNRVFILAFDRCAFGSGAELADTESDARRVSDFLRQADSIAGMAGSTRLANARGCVPRGQQSGRRLRSQGADSSESRLGGARFRLADAECAERWPNTPCGTVPHGDVSGWPETPGRFAAGCTVDGLADSCRAGRTKRKGPAGERPYTATAGAGRRDAEPGLGEPTAGLPARLAAPRWPARPGEQQHPWEAPRTVAKGAYPKGVRSARLKALGNCVVPQQAYPFFAWMAQYMDSLT